MFALGHLFFGSPVLCFHRIDSDLQMSNTVPLILRDVGGDDELEVWLAVNLSKRLQNCANALLPLSIPPLFSFSTSVAIPYRRA